MVRIELRHRKWLWRGLGIVAVCWLAVAVVRAALDVPGHAGLLTVLGARGCVLILGAVAGIFFLYILGALHIIWWERWDWLASRIHRSRVRAFNGKNRWHGRIGGPAEFIVWVVLELGLYWLAFLNGYGLVLLTYALYSLAWNGRLGIS